MKIRSILVLFILLLLTSCKGKEVEEKLYKSSDILYLNEDNQSVELSKQMDKLNDADKIATSSGKFNKVLSFIPNKEYIEYQTIHGDKFSYIKLPKTKNNISGRLSYENNTQEKIDIQSMFFQGNKNVLIKPTSSSKWVPSIQFQVPPHKSVTIDIDITWDKNGMQELTFFPLERTSDIYRYNGSILSSYRYFVQSKDIKIDNEMLKEQIFKVESDSNSSNYNFFPEPSWIGADKEDIEYLIKNDKPQTSKKIRGLKFDAVPYSTTVDILLADEFGNTDIIAETVKIVKNRITYYNIDEKILNRLHQTSKRQFLIIMNNRGERIIADVKAIEINKKPFPTSYQRVIEFYHSNQD